MTDGRMSETIVPPPPAAAGQPGARSGVPLYPALLAIAFVLSIVLTTGGSPYAGIRLLIGFAVGALLVSAAARLLLGDRDRAGIVAALVVVFVFKGIDWRVAILLLFAIGLILAERLVATRRPLRMPWSLAGRVANAASAVLLVAVLLRSAGDGSLGPYLGQIRSEGPTALREQLAVGTAAVGAPDVFLIILDGHARADKLETIFGHDEAPFLGELKARGFEVASASRSNYLLTAQSLPSMMNMGHIADIVDHQAASATVSGYTSEIRRLASNGLVFDEFRRLGYEVVVVASGFEEVALRGADRYVDTGQINELEVRTVGNTVVAPAIQLVASDWFADQHRSRVVAVIEAATQLAHEAHDRPRFVVAHVPSPHAPIVFGADGSAVPMHDLANFYDDTFTNRPGPKDVELARYAGQVSHIDTLVLPVVDEIIAGATTPPIILLLSDHGSAARVTWADLKGSDLDERTANLFAAYTPGRSGLFPADLSLVNVFGLLFESYFGREYTPEPNTAYRWTNVFLNGVPIDLPKPAPAK
jgi:hypothetical protein